MFAPASIPWLLGHELRIAWRAIGSSGRKGAARKKRSWMRSPVFGVAIVLLLATGAGIPAAIALRDTDIIATPLLAFFLTAASFLIFTLMLSQTLVGTVDAFYQRGDLDLLLSSPLPPRRILTVRALAIAVNPALLFGALFTPFLIPAAVLGHPQLLAAYPFIAALALAATSVGLALSMLLFSAIGPRRTRVVAQIIAAVMGAAFVIIAQLPNLVGDDDQFWVNWITGLVGGDEISPILAWPAEAIVGGPIQLLTILGAAIILFTLVARWVGRRFATDVATAQGAETRKVRTGRITTNFSRSVFRATMVKEARLILRDPGLISQVLLRVIYVIPLTFFVFRGDSGLAEFGGIIAAAAISLLAGQLAGSIAWITMSAEDSPELLASSPIPLRTFLMAKLAATLAVPAMIVLPVTIALMVFQPLVGIVALVTGIASAVSAGLINLWLQRPAKRAEFRRSWSSSFAANILELVASASWAAFAGMALAGLWWSLIPLVIALGVLVVSYRSEASLRDRMIGEAG